ncbi:MAG: hypothetical protein WC455_12320 [Dehalococcoidia bacterium]|jgi:hypothetical protein
MSGHPWKDAEIQWMRDQIAAGRNPRDFHADFNKQFPPRPFQAIISKLSREQISYMGTGATPDSENFDQTVMQDQAIHDLRRRLQSATARYEAALRDLNIQEKLIQFGRDSIGSLPIVEKPTPPAPDKNVTTESAVLLLSDLHIGEVIRSAEMRGLNEYNVDICNRRIKHLSNVSRDLLTYKLRGYRFDKLNILLLGDIVSGYIHDELAETGEGNIMDWTINGAYMLAQLIRDYLAVVPAVNIIGVVGNHGRVRSGPVRFKERYVNWDFVTYQYMSQFLRDEIRAGRVVCKFPQSFWTVEKIGGWNWLILHGDNIKSWAGIPWYGITRSIHRLKEVVAMQQDFINYVAIGHFHSLGTLDMMRGKMLINGSVMGGDEYSLGKLYTTSAARQVFCGLHPRTGITWEYNLTLQDAEKTVKAGFKTADLSEQSMGELDI